MIRFIKTLIPIILLSLCYPLYGNSIFKDTIQQAVEDSSTYRVQGSEKLPGGKNSYTGSPAELLGKYVSIESITGNEKEAGSFLAEVCREMGLNVEIFTNDKDTFNFAASLYPLELGKPNVILLNHIDVVPAEEPELWRQPPFSGAVVNDTVWGRGSIDNKGMAVMQLMAMKEFIEKAETNDFPFNVTLLSVSGEEKGGFTGARVIKERFLDRLNPLVVYGEGGTGLPDVLSSNSDRKLFGISIAAKRIIWLKLTLDMETSGHGSVPPVSYAVQEMIDALNRVTWRNNNRIVRFSEPTRQMFKEIGKLETGLKGIALRNMRVFRPFVVPVLKRNEIMYSLISNTVTVTGIRTKPGPPNQIPQAITATLDCRLLPEFTTEEFLDKVRSWLYNDNITIEIISEREMASPTKTDEYYYMMGDAIKNTYANAEVIPILSPASNDNNYFRSMDIPTYGIFPSFMSIELIESIHNINERLPVNRLEEGVQVYKELINMFLQEELEKISQN